MRHIPSQKRSLNAAAANGTAVQPTRFCGSGLCPRISEEHLSVSPARPIAAPIGNALLPGRRGEITVALLTATTPQERSHKSTPSLLRKKDHYVHTMRGTYKT